MKITEVGYGFTFNVGNYQSERLDCKVEVEEGETAQDALDKARKFVQQQHKRGAEVEQLEQHIMRLKNEERHASDRLTAVRNRWRETAERFNDLRALLQQHGVEIKPLDSYYLPPTEEDLKQAEEDDEEEEDDDSGDVWEEETEL